MASIQLRTSHLIFIILADPGILFSPSGRLPATAQWDSNWPAQFSPRCERRKEAGELAASEVPQARLEALARGDEADVVAQVRSELKKMIE